MIFLCIVHWPTSCTSHIIYFDCCITSLSSDIIMDMLGNQKMRERLTEQYELSKEPQLVRTAITAARLVHGHTCSSGTLILLVSITIL